ncbi:hypothetical protein [Mycolicibacterium sp.]|uniref:hypothetical protein n=1 Tax=Mycolicibacterium sp. TaxID=2320850 RepID=UPI003D118E7C
MTAPALLEDAAFGADPGRWPLPAAQTPQQRWLRAVAAGGQGRYGAALAELDRLGRQRTGGPLPSLARSTRASLWRQLGWHDRARGLDGQALALAGSAAEPVADALIGLAADALGVGRFAASARALQRAAPPVADSGSARLPVRLAWVSAELAMVRGDGADAIGHAERAVALAAALPSARHGVKSRVVLAAARCAGGDLDASRREADAVLADAGRLGLVPLQWAAACLLADIGSDERSRADLVALRDHCAQTVIRRGGVWRTR